jgi:AAA family ATP:ADP antiporter
MQDGRSYRLLRPFADIRPDEAGPALYLFLHFFLIALSIYIIKPAKENFLIGVTPAWWPYADFITAGLIGFVVAFNARLLKRLPRQRYFFWVAIFFIFNLIVLWLVFEIKEKGSAFGLPGIFPLLIRNIWPVPVFVFSFWSDIFIVMSVTHFWLTVNDMFNLRQAKRTVSFFVAGGLLGGITGSLLTSRLVHKIGPVNLLLICPVILVLNLVIIGLLYSEQQEPHRAAEPGETKPGYLDSLRTIRKDAYLRILSGVLASAVVVGCLINYQFKTAVRGAIPDDAARLSFLGSFFLGILLLSTIFHLLTTGQVLKHFGIRSGLLLGPMVLLLGSLAVFLVPAAGLIIWACVIRGSDKTFDNTISQSVRELLYIPVPSSIKYEAKIFIDMFVNKVAVGFGAVLFWVIYRVGTFADKPPAVQVQELGIVVAAFVLICIILIWNIYAEYLGAVKRDLTRKWQDAHRVLADHVDLEATRLIVDTLQSREKSSTLYAMNLFQLIQKEKLSPELLAFLSLKEEELKANAMDSVFDVPGEGFYREIEKTLTDQEVVTMVREIVALDSYESVMEKRLSDLIRNNDASEVERMEAAKLIGILKPTPAVRGCLDRLLQDSSPEVLIYALDSAAVHRFSEQVPPIISLLGNPMTRNVAQDALTAYGSQIEDLLRLNLHDANVNFEVRNAIPDILARIGDQKAADILSMELCQGEEELEQSLIEALYRIRSNRSSVRFKKKRIMRIVFSLIAQSYAIYLAGIENQSPESLPAHPKNWEPVSDLKTKRIFDLLTLMYPAEDIVKAYQNMLQGTRKSVDYSLELLDNVLDRDLKFFLFPIIEDLPPEEKAGRLRRLSKGLAQRLSGTEAAFAGRAS